MIISDNNCAVNCHSERYRIIQTLCTSKRSEVHLVKEVGNDKLHICKLNNSPSTAVEVCQRQRFLNEAQIIHGLKNKNIIQIESFCEQGQYIENQSRSHDCAFYLTEYYQQGDLLSLIMNNPSGLDESSTKVLFKQIVSGLGYMHSMGWAHGDVRLENCLVSDNGLVKIIDFEFSKPTQKLSQLFEGTDYYLAPEIIKHESYYPDKSDIFSSGCLLFSLFFGFPCFRSASPDDRLYSSFITKPESFWIRLENHCCKEISYELRYFLENMLTDEPSDRMDIKDIAQYSWLNNIV